MSANETLIFVQSFGLLFGEAVPHNDKHWHLYIYFKKIAMILMSKKLEKNTALHLKDLIKEHHNFYLELTMGKKFNYLKPKHHFMVHYPEIFN